MHYEFDIFWKEKKLEYLILIGQAICLLLIMHTHLYANIMQWMSSECIHLKVFIDISSSSQTSRNYQNTSLLRRLEKPSPLDSKPSTAKHVYISSTFVYIWAYIYLCFSIYVLASPLSKRAPRPIAFLFSPMASAFTTWERHIHSRSLLFNPHDAAIVSVVTPPRPPRVYGIRREAISAVSL